VRQYPDTSRWGAARVVLKPGFFGSSNWGHITKLTPRKINFQDKLSRSGSRNPVLQYFLAMAQKIPSKNGLRIVSNDHPNCVIYPRQNHFKWIKKIRVFFPHFGHFQHFGQIGSIGSKIGVKL